MSVKCKSKKRRLDSLKPWFSRELKLLHVNKAISVESAHSFVHWKYSAGNGESIAKFRETCFYKDKYEH